MLKFISYECLATWQQHYLYNYICVMGIHRVNWYVQSEDDRLVKLSTSSGSCGQGYNSDLFFLVGKCNCIISKSFPEIRNIPLSILCTLYNSVFHFTRISLYMIYLEKKSCKVKATCNIFTEIQVQVIILKWGWVSW